MSTVNCKRCEDTLGDSPHYVQCQECGAMVICEDGPRATKEGSIKKVA